MINNDRIVPITAFDLISMYGLILVAMLGTNNKPVALSANTTNGEFEVSEAGTFLLDEPLKSCKIATGISGSVDAYFVPAYDYSGFTVNGAAVTTEGDVTADGRTLYHAVIDDGAVTITKVGY